MGDDRLQHVVPAMGAVDITRTRRTVFQIAEPVEHEQPVIAGTEVMVVTGDTFLVTVMA